MIISKPGRFFIKLQNGDNIVAVNPVSKDSKEKTTKFGADVALVSLNHPDMNGVTEVEFGEKKPFAITGPGEYEIKEIFIKGIASRSKYGGKEGINTIYVVNMDNFSLCFLGLTADGKLSPEALEEIDGIDILFVPVSKDTLSASDAYKLAISMEPKVIIPLGDEADVKTFIKESGEEKPEKVDKLVIKKKDLEGKEGEIMLLQD